MKKRIITFLGIVTILSLSGCGGCRGSIREAKLDDISGTVNTTLAETKEIKSMLEEQFGLTTDEAEETEVPSEEEEITALKQQLEAANVQIADYQKQIQNMQSGQDALSRYGAEKFYTDGKLRESTEENLKFFSDENLTQEISGKVVYISPVIDRPKWSNGLEVYVGRSAAGLVFTAKDPRLREIEQE